MSPHDQQTVHQQISASTFLSQIEKAEWIQLLPEMTEAQRTELASILDSAAERAMRKGNLGPAKQGLPEGTELMALEDQVLQDLPGHVQPEALEAPAVVAPQVVPPAPAARPVVPTPVVHAQPAWQAQVSAAPIQPVAPVKPAAAPAKPAPVAQPAPPVPLNIVLKAPEDLQKLDMAFMRNGDPKQILSGVLRAFTDMTKKYPITDMLGKIELSPLYKTYYKSGFAALNAGSLPIQGMPDTMSKTEFELFTDFRRDMERIIS